jgi:ABC-2 type transport system permease protein
MKVILLNILAIYRRELQSYFASPLAYVVATVYWLLAGLFFVAFLLSDEGYIKIAALRDAQAQQLGIAAPAIDVPYEFLQAFLGVLASLSLVILPILSMGLYAEERKRGTLELLATSPITNWAVAVGKLLGVMTFFATLQLPLLLYEVMALRDVNPPMALATLALGHAGLLLLAAAVLSLGMFISALTDSTILAAISTFALILLLWVTDLVAKNLPGGAGDIVGHLSLLKHYTTLTQGVVDTSSLVLFGSYIGLGIFLTAQSIEALRFQRS